MKIGGTTSSIAICCLLRTLYTFVRLYVYRFSATRISRRSWGKCRASLLIVSLVARGFVALPVLPSDPSGKPLSLSTCHGAPRLCPPVDDRPCTRSSAMDNKERQAARCHPETLRTALVLESIAHSKPLSRSMTRLRFQLSATRTTLLKMNRHRIMYDARRKVCYVNLRVE